MMRLTTIIIIVAIILKTVVIIKSSHSMFWEAADIFINNDYPINSRIVVMKVVTEIVSESIMPEMSVCVNFPIKISLPFFTCCYRKLREYKSHNLTKMVPGTSACS